MTRRLRRWRPRRRRRHVDFSVPSVVRRFGSMLPTGEELRVVLLADSTVGDEIEVYLSHYADAETYVFSGRPRPEWHLHAYGARFRQAARAERVDKALSEIGPVDLMIDLRAADSKAHLRLWTVAFFHLRQDGVYVVTRRPVDRDATTKDRLVQRLRSLSNHIGATPAFADTLPPPRREEALAVRSIVIDADVLLIQKRNSHVLKVRDERATTLLHRREPALEVTELAIRSGGSVDGDVVSHHDPQGSRFAKPLVSPRLYLRRYEGPIAVMPRGLVVVGDSVLPLSYRFHLAANLHHTWMENTDERFGRIRPEHLPDRLLEGHYYHFDYANSGHFGHLTTEALAKLWGWDEAKRADPELKILYGRGTGHPHAPRLEDQFLRAYGIAEEDIVAVDEPVWVESLVGATPMWHNDFPYAVHPDIAQIWQRIRRGLTDDNPVPGAEKVFVSRRPIGNRPCVNVAEVERFFADAGFTIIHPEEMSLVEQATLFSSVRTVAGFGGSGMFNLMYPRELDTVIALNSDVYFAQNEYLFGAVHGAHVHYFWGTSDEESAEDTLHRSWHFDVERNRAELSEVLRHT